MPGPRRSKRERKQAQYFYEEVEEKYLSPPLKKKSRRSRSDKKRGRESPPEEEAEHEQQENKQEEQEEEDREEEDQEEEEQEEEQKMKEPEGVEENSEKEEENSEKEEENSEKEEENSEEEEENSEREEENSEREEENSEREEENSEKEKEPEEEKDQKDEEQEEEGQEKEEAEFEEEREEKEEPDENEDDYSDDEDEEEYTPRTAAQNKRRPSSSTTTRKSPPQARPSPPQARPSPRSKTPPKQQQRKQPRSRARVPAAARKGAHTALSALAKKFLDTDNESPETSLVAALLYAGKASSSKDTVTTAHPRNDYPETLYTRNLIQVARRVYDDHYHDPNGAQVALYNLLFRSVGATYEALLDPSHVDLENISDEDMTEYIKAIVHSMEETPVEQVLLLADNNSSNHKLPVAIREYHAIYREFWYLLGVTVLSDSLSGDSSTAPAHSAKKRKHRDNDSEEEDEEDGGGGGEEQANNGSHSPQGFRFQIEMVHEVLKRMIELSLLGQDDLRAGTTIAVYQLAVAILERTVELRGKLQVAERQLLVAKQSRMKRKAEALESQTQVWNRMCTQLEGLVTETIMGIFVKRYKDTHPMIRAESMRVMARFVVTRPDMFLKNAYLKYLGWMLSDKTAIVRQQAVAGFLAPFQENQERASKLKKRGGKDVEHIDTSLMAGIAEKFASRLADCTMDVEVSVQEQAMRLLLVFSREGLLDSVENETFWNQINGRALAKDTSTAVRRDALLFVLEQLQAFDSSNIQSESDAVERINSLATWITHCIGTNTVPIEKLPYDRVAFVVTSLRLCPEHGSLVENYSAMLRALKECGDVSASESKRRLEVIQRRVLLEMLVASVEQEMSGLDSLEGVVDPDLLAAQRAQEEAALGKKKKKKEGLQEKLTVAMLEALPDLLASLKTETDLMRGLTTLPKYFLPSVLNTSNQRKYFSALLDQLSSLFLTATDQTVLFNCCLTMTLLAKGDHTRSSEALVVLKRGISSVCDELAGLLEDKFETTEDPSGKLDVELSASLCLRRLAIVSKRWSISTLINGGQTAVEKLATDISQSVANDLNARIPVISEDSEDLDGIAPEIWQTAPARIHEVVQDSTIAALSFLLSTTAWTLREKLATDGEEREDAAFLVRMRDRISRLASLCFEMYLDEDNDIYDQNVVLFSRAIQVHAMQITGDLSSLFPKEWAASTDPLLRACAFTEDTPLVGGSVRFLKTQGDKLRLPKENKEVSQSLLLPIARGLCSNWRVGNRREAGTALPHIVGSGEEATAIISSMSRVLKKTDAVRLLEAHMAGFRQVYDDWTENEPIEPQSNHPSEEELEKFEEAEKAHRAKLELMEQQAKRLSSSLGVGRLGDKSLKPAMLGFIREGIRFAFSTEDPNGGEPLFLGARLPFLGIISKYYSWIRNDKTQVETIRAVLNEKEAELRNHPSFEDVLEDDLKALHTFRQTCNIGSFLIEDDDEKTKGSASAGPGASVASNCMRRRMSHASSVSSIVSKTSTQKTLSPLPEEEAKGNEDDEDGEESKDVEDDEKSHTSSISSKVREAPEAPKHAPIEEASEESSEQTSAPGEDTKGHEDGKNEQQESGAGEESKSHDSSLPLKTRKRSRSNRRK